MSKEATADVACKKMVGSRTYDYKPRPRSGSEYPTQSVIPIQVIGIINRPPVDLPRRLQGLVKDIQIDIGVSQRVSEKKNTGIGGLGVLSNAYDIRALCVEPPRVPTHQGH